MKQINYLAYTLLVLCLVWNQASFAGQQQDRWTIRGTVVSQAQEPLEGVSISLKGSAVASTTDKDGRFQLLVPPTNGELVLSYIGKREKTVRFTGPGEFRLPLRMKLRKWQK